MISNSTNIHTELDIDGKTVVVHWTECRDTLIPENKNIIDRWIDSVEPPVDIDDDTLLEMVVKEEENRR